MMTDYISAIWSTAVDPTYDEVAIRKVVSFELAELIAAARARYEAQQQSK